MIVSPPPVNACIIDNNTTYVYGFKKLLNLKNLSSRVCTFNNGSEAISYFKNPLNANNLPDVIFLDISMPVMDGWEFMNEFAEIKSQLGKKITIYILSSSTDINDIERAKKNSDISDYIIKPVDVSRLAKIFRDLNDTN
ncbi:response regulator [Mucilaginibacter sabulilitoris]|uniref:Response regulator n=1 Tax=Mucilaginibacter sabulilitoris TaxID=1173583 RepID=A0ABZ0TL24_9SPHI|nr:response regulator [Mucilaginibacter sabulilitoris]WPU93112.1 response regulator [Mucilaginibacter sabulilitoris]